MFNNNSVNRYQTHLQMGMLAPELKFVRLIMRGLCATLQTDGDFTIKGQTIINQCIDGNFTSKGKLLQISI